MKILLIVCGIVFVMNWLVFFTVVYDVKKEGDKLGLKYRAISFFSAFWTIIELSIMFLIPIYNIIVFFVCVFNFDEIKEEALNKIILEQNPNE